MITLNKLKAYAKYGGDIDALVRMNNHQLVSDTEWSLISSLLQDWFVVKSGLASQEYITSFNQKLADSIDNNESIDYFKSMKSY